MRHRILSVEDNPANRELLSDWLETEGYEVLTAAVLPAAFLAVENENPHAVLLDVQLGGDDGLKLAQWMRQDPRFQSIPIVAVTANAMVTEEERLLQAGCNGYVPKPIDFQKLRQHLQRWLPASGVASSSVKSG
jgi:two-component system cell cycle response regulator DivK